MNGYTKIFNQGGPVTIDDAQPGDRFAVVGSHTRLRVRNGGAFDAPEFVIEGLLDENGERATFTDAADHNIVNCKNVVLCDLVFNYRLHFRDDEGKPHHSGGLVVSECRIAIPANADVRAIKVTPAPARPIDGILIERTTMLGGGAYLGQPHWSEQPEGAKREIKNVVFRHNEIKHAPGGVRFKGAHGVVCEHNFIYGLTDPHRCAIWIADGTAGVLARWNIARECAGNGVHIVPGVPGGVSFVSNLFDDCAAGETRYPGAIYISQRQGIEFFHNTCAGDIVFSKRVNYATVQGNVVFGKIDADFALGRNYVSATVDPDMWDDDYRPLVDAPGDPCDKLTVDLDGVEYADRPTMGAYQYVEDAPMPPQNVVVGREYWFSFGEYGRVRARIDE
jgi:hypothetical protein